MQCKNEVGKINGKFVVSCRMLTQMRRCAMAKVNIILYMMMMRT